MNYLLSFVVLCFFLSGCAATGMQIGKSDNSESFKADQVSQVTERGPRNPSGQLATADDPSKTTKSPFFGPTNPDQF